MTVLDDDQQRTDLGKIHNAAHNLLALVNDLLDYQKIIQGAAFTLEADRTSTWLRGPRRWPMPMRSKVAEEYGTGWWSTVQPTSGLCMPMKSACGRR